MIPFLVGLLAIVSAFTQSGKPANTPPYTSDEVRLRGGAVSETAKNLDTSAGDETDTDEDPATVEESLDDSSDEEDTEDASNVEAQTKVAAYNTKSGKYMPTLLPKVAVDNSVALEEAGALTPTVTPGETETEGEEADSSDFDNERGGKAFGQATADAAKNKRN